MHEKKENDEQIQSEFPREITFKIVYYNKPTLSDTIKSCLTEKNLSYELGEKVSSNGKFISFTVSAIFESEELLQNICGELQLIEGYKMMF
jgi:putative lipoic acid-binding regulatory protein